MSTTKNTATQVVYRWAGELINKVNQAFWADAVIQRQPINAETAKWDYLTDRES